MATSNKTTAQEQNLEAAQAAQWRLIEPMLPEIIRRGCMALLEGQEPTKELGLSTDEPAALVSLIDWRNIPNAQLLQETSPPAIAERLRRSLEAFEQFNTESDFQLAPHPDALSALADVATTEVEQWLARSGHRDKLQEYLRQLGYLDVNAAKTGNAIALSQYGRRSLRQLIKWSEASYGEYQW